MGGLRMTAMGGMRALTRTGSRLAAVLGLAGLALTGCGSAGGPGDASAKLLTSIAGAMEAQGHDSEAGVARSSNVHLTRVPADFAGRWRIYQVDGNRPHTEQFTVGVGPDRVVLLTGNPAAFGPMAQAAGAHVGNAAQAVRLARLYLRTTRPTDVLSYTVDDIRQVRFRPGLTGADAARRAAIVRRYRSVVTPAKARPAPGCFTVTAYTVRDRALQRRTLEIGRSGTVKDDAKTLVGDLPVPYTA